MKTLRYSFATQNEYSAPITGQQLVLHCTPRADEGQRPVQAVLDIAPAVPLRPLRDGFGNEIYCISVNEPHTRLDYTAAGVVQVQAAAPAPPPQPLYRLPGALTRPGASLRQWYGALGIDTAAGAQQVCGLLCDAVHARMEYLPGATGVATTAEQALAGGAGVCQDYAQLFCVLARLAGLPVRYCMGLTVGEGATHAWAEVYYGGAWHGWDATRARQCDDGYIRLAVGRDAADCPVERGIFYGLCSQLQTVRMEVWEV